MRVFIDFWKLETENSFLHVFSFLHKLSFENIFYFLPILSCQTSFLVSKIEFFFWKQKIRKKNKNSYQTYDNFPIWLLSKKKKKKNTKFPFMVQIPSHTVGSIIHQIIGMQQVHMRINRKIYISKSCLFYYIIYICWESFKC